MCITLWTRRTIENFQTLSRFIQMLSENKTSDAHVRLSLNLGMRSNSGSASCEAIFMKVLLGLRFGLTAFRAWERQKEFEELLAQEAFRVKRGPKAS